VILLRTDLFEIYDIQEKNKFVSRMIRLKWEERELQMLMRTRLCANEALQNVSKLAREPDSLSSCL